MNSKILFLCTGNYYRSRLAEEWFNHLARESRLDWEASSRGLAENFGLFGNPGPMASQSLKKLKKLGVSPKGTDRYPQYAKEADFRNFQRVIALSESEHRPMMRLRFPGHASSIEYWTVEDLHLESAKSAMGRIVEQVRALVDELKSE